jgi:hypothetical protein
MSPQAAAAEQSTTDNQVSALVRESNPSEPLAGYWTKPEVAAKLRTTTRTLDRWHVERIGPPRISVGNRRSRTILYKISELLAWLDAQQQRPVRPCRTRTSRRGRAA